MIRARALMLTGSLTLTGAASASAQVIELIVPQVGVTFMKYSGDLIDSDTGVGFEAGAKIRAGGRATTSASGTSSRRAWRA